MTTLDVDILAERIGPFVIGQQIALPASLTDDKGYQPRAGDALHIEPYRDVSVVLSLSAQDDGQLIGQVVQMIVDDSSDAFLDGVPMRQTSLKSLLEKLRAAGRGSVFQSADSVMILDCATLGVFGDNVDKVILGGDPQCFKRPWRDISDRATIEAITRAAQSALR